MRILRSESERAVDEIVAADPLLSASENWHPLDRRNTNFNVVTNQAATGEKALTEMCTNMVDAVLLKAAHLKPVDPYGPDAPQSVLEGIRTLVPIRGMRTGILPEADDRRALQEFAEAHLVIGVTGGATKGEPPCFTFVDNGEGQHPQEFEDTFLSLSKGNKSGIPFVQGKYNMGSSGVLSYAGRHWYKLVISRRYDVSGDWGWTLVRRQPGGGTPIAEYFRPGPKIPSFPAPEWLHPLARRNGDIDEMVRLTTGTVVKLYDYQLSVHPSRNNIREALNENLVSTGLPIRLIDYRNPESARRSGRRALGIDERSLNGMEFQLLRLSDNGDADGPEEDSAAGDIQKRIHDIGFTEHPDLGKVSVRAVELGRDLPGWLKPSRNTTRVYHAVNGQVQLKENRYYLSQTCKLPGLKDRIILMVDASDLSEAGYNDVWKGDRETVRATGMGQLYREEVTKIISDSEILKELQRRIALEETEALAKKEQTELFQGLVDADPSIAQLLPGGATVKLRRGGSLKPRPEWIGKRSPTFLEVISREIREKGAEIGIGGKRSIAFRTDVVNDYLIRPDNKGRVRIGVEGGQGGEFSWGIALNDGRLTVTFEAIADRVVAGDDFRVTVDLADDSMHTPVSADFVLRAVEHRKPRPPGPKPPPEPGEEEDGARGLPMTLWLTRDGREIGGDPSEQWPDDFTEQDGGDVREIDADQRVYRINYDNAHFQRVLAGERTEPDKRVVTEQYRLGLLVLMMGLEKAYELAEPARKTEVGDFDPMRRLAAQGSATVVMSLVKTLPAIVNPASVTDPDD